jgi:hypothetical protein
MWLVSRLLPWRTLSKKSVPGCFMLVNYTKAISDAGAIDPGQGVRKLAVAVEAPVAALEVFTDEVLPAPTR